MLIPVVGTLQECASEVTKLILIFFVFLPWLSLVKKIIFKIMMTIKDFFQNVSFLLEKENWIVFSLNQYLCDIDF
jgi:hypothetical protein